MARLPTYQGDMSLNTGSQFMRPIDAPMGVARGLNQLGNSLESVAAHIKVGAERSKANVDRVEAAQAVMNLAAYEREETDRLRTESENIEVSGADFQRRFMEGHQKRAEAFYSTLSDDLKVKLGPQIAQTINQFDDASYKVEQRKVAEYSAESLKAVTETASSGVLAGRDPSEVRTQLWAAIDTLKLPENRAAEARKIANQAVDAAITRRFIQENPAEAERQLRDQAIGTPTGLSPVSKLVYDTALRYGHDPKLMLMIQLAENSKGNPTLGNPDSSAYGLFQLIDGDWAETGIPKTSDPNLQTEAMARRMTFLKNTLTRNGLELTPRAMYGAHFLGRGGYVHVASADPNGNFFETYARVAGRGIAVKALKGNWRLLGTGNLTNAQVLQRIENYATGRYNTAVKAIDAKTDFKPDEPAIINGHKLEGTTRGDIAKFLAEAEKVQSAVNADEAKELTAMHVKAAKAGTLATTPNAYDKDFRNALTTDAENSGVHDAMLSNDPEVAKEAVSGVIQTADQFGMIPAPATAAVQHMMTSPDPAKRQMGFDIAARTHVSDPIRGLEHSGFVSENRKDVERYTSWIAKGYSPQDAIARVDREKENIKRNAGMDFTTRVKEGRAERTWDELSNVKIEDANRGLAPWKDTSWGGLFTSVNREPTDELTKEFLVNEYRDAYEYHLKSGVSDEQAVRSAQMDVRNLLGTTKLFGREQNTLYPPERVYPPDTDKGHTYVERQALEQAMSFVDDYNKRNLDQKIEVNDLKEQILLRPTGRTASEVAARRLGRDGENDKLPTMDLIIIDQRGVVHGPLDFRPDLALEARRTKEAKAEPVPTTATKKETSKLLEDARKRQEEGERFRRENETRALESFALSP